MNVMTKSNEGKQHENMELIWENAVTYLLVFFWAVISLKTF